MAIPEKKMTDANHQRIAILQRLANHDAEWSWYQLDRALSTSGTILGANLVRVLNEMEQENLLLSIPTKNPAHPVYKLTGKAWALVHRC